MSDRWIKYAPQLEKYCTTEHQVMVLREVAARGNAVAAAEALGIDGGNARSIISKVRRRAAEAGFAPWAGLDVAVPDNLKVKGTTTLYGEDGTKRLQWVKTNERLQEQYDATLEAIKALAGKAEPMPDIPLLREDHHEDLLAVYPVGDHHFGMFSDPDVTGSGRGYDLDKASRLLARCHGHLLSHTPNTADCLIVLLGDFLHYDSMHAVTPKHKNQLDASGSPLAMVKAATKGARNMVEQCLAKHRYVTIMVVGGNHDPFSTLLMGVLLQEVYEHSPRVKVLETYAQTIQAHTFGANLLAATHGDKLKPERLGEIIPATFRREWAACPHVVVHTGHVHHKSIRQKDQLGVSVETHGVLCPPDAHAAGLGYTHQRSIMQSITYHIKHGEWSRYIVTPAMVDEDR